MFIIKENDKIIAVLESIDNLYETIYNNIDNFINENADHDWRIEIEKGFIYIGSDNHLQSLEVIEFTENYFNNKSNESYKRDYFVSESE